MRVLRLYGFLLCVLWNAQSFAQAFFVQNEGQWAGDFSSKLELKQGAVFFNQEGYRVLLVDEAHHHDHGHHHGPNKALAYQVEFSNAEGKAWESCGTEAYPRNYFLGNDPNNWKSNIASRSQAKREDIYPGIDLLFYESNELLKFDISLDAVARPEQIKMIYHGTQGISVEEGKLIVQTAFGQVKESIPYSYQIINGKRVEVKAKYLLSGDTVRFSVEDYQPNYPLVIDPVLEFATFSGSGDLNFGNSATYGENGTMYGAGVNFGVNYPTTLGVFQPSFAGDSIFNVDVTISKFSADGSRLLYATYLGGRDIEVAHSLISDSVGNLILLGNTGSNDFPTSVNAFQKNYGGGDYLRSFAFNDYNHGSDIFIAKISANGQQLLGSTFWGGSKNDGINEDIYFNYGDHYRGEVLLTDHGDIAVLSSTKSMNVPLRGNNAQDRNQNSQDAIIGLFNDDLSTLIWGRYYGDLQADAGYALKISNDKLFITGATESGNLPMHINAYQDSKQGGIDGYVASFDLDDGDFRAATYFGTNQRDQSFLLDIDHYGSVYIAGQTNGALNISPGVYNNPSSRQFIAKLDSNLSALQWQTMVGSGQNKQDLVPSAFMVDRCLNIYFSGWNGSANMVGFPGTQNGNTLGLPVTQDAFQSSTDGSDFYFMILGHDASSLLTASYLGGNDNEHVDGGTSRFNKDGTIYQAVCSNCNNQSFPTTPGAYATSSGGPSCNMAVFKFSFNQILEANASISFTTGVDSICDGLIVNLENQSTNATNYTWDFGNGDLSTDVNPSITYRILGSYTITLIAYDSICNISDTSYLQIEHTAVRTPISNFMVDYTSCDNNKEASFHNLSIIANSYEWNFGDGVSSNEPNPFHQYTSFGVYEVMMVAKDTVCQRADTIYKTIEFRDTSSLPEINVSISSCSNGELEISNTSNLPWLIYNWETSGKNYQGSSPVIRFFEPGQKIISLTIEDTICNKIHQNTYTIQVDDIREEVYTATAFTPNGDGLNDKFEIFGDPCDESANLKIFNRWGTLVYETNEPYSEFWDGTYRGQNAPGGVYTYVILESQRKITGFFSLVR